MMLYALGLFGSTSWRFPVVRMRSSVNSTRGLALPLTGLQWKTYYGSSQVSQAGDLDLYEYPRVWTRPQVDIQGLTKALLRPWWVRIGALDAHPSAQEFLSEPTWLVSSRWLVVIPLGIPGWKKQFRGVGFYEKHLRFEEMGDNKPFKIRGCVEPEQYGIAASTLNEVIDKGCTKLKVNKPTSYPSIYDTWVYKAMMMNSWMNETL